MNLKELKALIEAYMFLSDDPLIPSEIANRLGISIEDIEKAILMLEEELNSDHRGIQIEKAAGGYFLVTKPELYEKLLRLGPVKKKRLSRASLETLAIIAYRQPISLPEINEIRGKDSSFPLSTLIEKGLVRAAGRKKVPGRPFLYETTEEFLKLFGLNSLEELPRDDET
ncbi:MAG: SMC-Scp complex subunit ScpB [Candidatus Aminicenantes bacterium]|nr:SMC-Scp complex subunit ScpB [Candidatus Aminicenantes bacterium]